MRNTKQSMKALLILLTLLCFNGCAELNDPYYQSRDPYYGGGSYGNSGYYDNSYNARREADRARQARRDLEEERYRLEQERRRAEREREQNAYRPPPPPPRQQERCPAGFSPSENKCSQAERKRGCRDIRLPGGLGCVSR